MGNLGHLTQIKGTAAARAGLPSPTSVCDSLVFTYFNAIGNRDLSFNVAKAAGDTLLLFFDFQLPRKLCMHGQKHMGPTLMTVHTGPPKVGTLSAVACVYALYGPSKSRNIVSCVHAPNMVHQK